MTSQHYTGTHPFYIGMYIHKYTHIYVHIYFPEGMFTYFFLGDSAALELGGKDGKRAGALSDSDPTSLIRAIQLS